MNTIDVSRYRVFLPYHQPPQRVSLRFPSLGSLSQVPHVRSSKLNSSQDTLRHDDKVAPQILLLSAVSFEGCFYVCS